MHLRVQSTHCLIGCNNGVRRYVNHIRLSGFNSVHLEGPVSEHKKYCSMCPRIKCILNKVNPAKVLADRFLRGPDDFVVATLSDNPLAVVQINEMGPLFIGTAITGITKLWLLICVEIVTREIHILPMQFQDTVSFIECIEILQARRGKVAKIILDAHLAHGNLRTPDQGKINCLSPTLKRIINSTQTNELQKLHKKTIQ